MAEHDGGRRVAVVTGGSRGIGRAIARKLAGQGLAVVVTYSGNTEAADETVRSITDAGGDAVAVKADVADETQVAEVFAEAERRYGGVDVLVSCAGIMLLSPLADLDLADLDRMHRTNIRGLFVVNRQAVRSLRPGGSIVNLSTSVVGLQLPTYSAYTASKGAAEAMTLIVARELRGRDITINAVAPGPTDTELFTADKSQEQIDQAAKQAPLERLGQPDDIAELTAFLVSPQGHWVNGQVVRANGGVI